MQRLIQCLSNRVIESHNSAENQDLFRVLVKQQSDWIVFDIAFVWSDYLVNYFVI